MLPSTTEYSVWRKNIIISNFTFFIPYSLAFFLGAIRAGEETNLCKKFRRFGDQCKYTQESKNMKLLPPRRQSSFFTHDISSYLIITWHRWHHVTWIESCDSHVEIMTINGTPMCNLPQEATARSDRKAMQDLQSPQHKCIIHSILPSPCSSHGHRS